MAVPARRWGTAEDVTAIDGISGKGSSVTDAVTVAAPPGFFRFRRWVNPRTSAGPAFLRGAIATQLATPDLHSLGPIGVVLRADRSCSTSSARRDGDDGSSVLAMAVVAQSSLTSSAMGWPVVLASLSLILLALGLAWSVGLRIERELIGASVRAAVQLLTVGFVFALIFGSTAAIYWAWIWVGMMTVLATVVVVRRAKHRIHRLALVTACAVLGSALISIAVAFGFRLVDYRPVSLIVIAGITIGNAVPSAVLGVNQSVGLCRDRIGDLEALLSLGLDRRQIVQFMAPRMARSSLIPQIERTKVVGLIALPGAMTGLLLAGVDPVEAVVIQLLVMYLVLGTAAVCVVSVVTAVTRAAVTADLIIADWVPQSNDGNPRLA